MTLKFDLLFLNFNLILHLTLAINIEQKEAVLIHCDNAF